MEKIYLLLVSAIIILACQHAAFAELSSKAKKAEKLISEGNIQGATEIYRDLMAKDPKKNANLVKEGREGFAKMELGLEKVALKNKHYDDAEKYIVEITTGYKDTASVKPAYQDLVVMRLDMGNKLLDGGKYDACVTLMGKTLKTVPADTDGVKDLAELSGKALVTASAAANKALDNQKALDYLTEFGKAGLPADDPLTLRSVEISSTIAKEQLTLAESDTAAAKYDTVLKDIGIALAASKDEAVAAQAGYDTGVAYRLSGQAEKAAASYKDVLLNHKTSDYAAHGLRPLPDEHGQGRQSRGAREHNGRGCALAR